MLNHGEDRHMSILDNIKSAIRPDRNQITQDSSNVTTDGLDNEINRLRDISNPSHDEVIEKLLGNIEKIDFHELADIDPGKNLIQYQTIVISIQNIINLAKRHNWGICQNNGLTFLYNGAFWQQIDDKKLQMFLGQTAEKQGISNLMAKHYDFREKLLKQFKNIAILPVPQTNHNKVLINLQNGTLQFYRGDIQLKVFDPDDFLKYQLPFKYDKDAVCPLFNQYLNRVLPEKELQDIITEFLGYVFMPQDGLKLEKALLLYGSGANGKSVLFDIINALFGKENICSYSISELTDDKGYSRAMLGDKLLNYASELSSKFETSVLKQLISGEPISARLPYGNPFNMHSYAKFMFNVNDLPKDVEFNHAFFRRFLIIPFQITIPEDEQDKELAKKIIETELPGVLNLILKGLDRLTKQKGFTNSKIVENTIAKFKKEADSTLLFIEEFNYQSDNEAYKPLKHIYSEYRTFCLENSYKPLSNINFKKRINSHGFETLKKREGQVIFLRIDQV